MKFVDDVQVRLVLEHWSTIARCLSWKPPVTDVDVGRNWTGVTKQRLWLIFLKWITALYKFLFVFVFVPGGLSSYTT